MITEFQFYLVNLLDALIFNNSTEWHTGDSTWETGKLTNNDVTFKVNQHRKKKKNRTRLVTYALVVS